MLRFACVSLGLLAATSRADFQFSRFHAELNCAGDVIQTVANYLGCLRGSDGTTELSYDVSCINASAFDVSYYDGPLCAGPVIHTTTVGWESGCQGSADAKLTFESVCTSGSYVPTTNTVNTFLYVSEHTCPLERPSLYSGVVSIPKLCHPAEGRYFMYGCDKENVTAVPFAKPDCSGKPAGPPIALAPLGCADPRAPDMVAKFMTCGAVPTASSNAAGAVGMAGFGAAVDSDAVGTAVAAGVARALELIAKRRA